jgi:hypothetical protein
MKLLFSSLHVLAKWLRYLAETLDRIDSVPCQTHFSPLPDEHSLFEGMLRCAERGESWQDTMDSNGVHEQLGIQQRRPRP